MTEPDHIARLRAFRQYKDSFATDELKDALALLDDYDALAARLAEATELLARAEDDLAEWERVYEANPDTTRLRLEIAGFRAAEAQP